MPITAAEQYLIELINRARLDPAAAQERNGLDLNANLPASTIDTEARQVLSPNAELEQAAVAHSAWMLQTDTFSHTGDGNTTPGARMAAAGYDFVGKWTWRENLAWTGTTGAINLTTAVQTHHEGLYRSEGHRVNIFAPEVREIGVAQVEGEFTYQGRAYNTSMLTEQFASSGQNVFITGVAYEDRDGDDFYGVGEGQSGVWVKTDTGRTNTADAGGYGLAVNPAAVVDVAVGRGGDTLATLRLDLTQGNAKLDLVQDRGGDLTLALSGHAVLETGVSDARLLGSGDLNLTGHAGNNHLTGNRGNNRIEGGGGRDKLAGGDGRDRLSGDAGHDKLLGGGGRDTLSGGDGNDKIKGNGGADRLSGDAGHDKLIGGGGRDWLSGGDGNDLLKGGGGADTFVFTGGADRIVDFRDDIDRVLIDRGLFDGGDVMDHAQVVRGAVVFDFGHGDVLTLSGISNLSALADDLGVI